MRFWERVKEAMGLEHRDSVTGMGVKEYAKELESSAEALEHTLMEVSRKRRKRRKNGLSGQ